MRRLRRWLFNIAAGVSLLFLIATGILWIRSITSVDTVRFLYGGASYHLVVGNSSITCSRIPNYAYPEDIKSAWSHQPIGKAYIPVRPPQAQSHRLFGFEYWQFQIAMLPAWFLAHPNQTGGAWPTPADVLGIQQVIRAPFWPFIVVSALLPAFWVYRAVHRRNRVRAGHCPTCGYDLRATPERCPECGYITGVSA